MAAEMAQVMAQAKEIAIGNRQTGQEGKMRQV